MNEDFTKLCDPYSGGILYKEEAGVLMEIGGTKYPIINSIPRFVDIDNYADDFGKQWNKYRRTQLDSYTGCTATSDRLARCMNGHLEAIKGKLVLEAGSGAGRFTEVLLRHGALVHSFDYSTAVEANAENNGNSDKLTLVQADIRHIPFQNATYDYVICLGVLQHTPNTEESIKCLWQKVRPGGFLVIDHYRFSWKKMLPPPIGGAQELYRQVILRLPKKYRMNFVTRIVDFFFPIHWRFRDSMFAKRILSRVSPVCFHYGAGFGLATRQLVYEWALLDTHDGTTDFYRHLRTVEQIRANLLELGAINISVMVGGNGVEAFCQKPE